MSYQATRDVDRRFAMLTRFALLDLIAHILGLGQGNMPAVQRSV
jgi:hypothetical protein